MRVGGPSIVSARLYSPVHTPQTMGDGGELKAPARTDTREVEVAVEVAGGVDWASFNSGWTNNGESLFLDGAASSCGAGADGQSQQRGQDQGRRQPGQNTCVAIDGSVVETGVSQQPPSTMERLIGGARRLFGL